MRTLFVVLIACMTGLQVYAQELQEITLNTPDKTRESVTMKALSDRMSVREYDTRDLSLQDLSDLLCAAVGLATVPRASMDQAELSRVLKLSETQLPILNNPVGYPKQ